MLENNKEEQFSNSDGSRRKRGRPKRGNNVITSATGNYFDDAEAHIPLFIIETDIEKRNKIFTDHIERPLHFMTQTILKVFFRSNEFPIDLDDNEIIQETVVYTIEKIHMFDVNRGTKAYSYIQTIIKHYIYSIFKEYEKKSLNINIPIDTVFPTVANFSDNTDTVAEQNELVSDLFKQTIDDINNAIENAEQYSLTSKDVLVGKCIVFLMKNWEEIYENLGTQKYNRNVFLYYIREATFLETKKIRESIKKFRDIYKNTKQSFLHSLNI